jgi:hypothetical protein
MKQVRVAGATMVALLLLAGVSLADDSAAVEQEKVTQSGFIGLEAGEIVHGVKESNAEAGGSSSNGFIDKAPLERLLFQYVNDYAVTKHIRAVIAMECQLGFSYPYDLFLSLNVQSAGITVYPDRAEGLYTLDDLPMPLKLQFGFGYFPFRTDPDVKNLGEYLFRTGTYPTYVVNNFNRPYARLLGVRASATAWDCLHADVLLTSATQYMPLEDYSLTFLGSFNLAKVFELGGGVSFTNIIPADSSITSPRNPGAEYLEKNGDTGYYTFKAVKPMGRFALDPKPLLPDELRGLLGSGDSRLYGEICVTGWTNYVNYDTNTATRSPNYYTNRWDRTLFMLGYNVPTFKTFDVVSVEVEHKSNKYPNSMEYLLQSKGPPLPIPSLTSDITTAGSSEPISPWYWSVYVKKTFLRKFAVIAQAAHDHMRAVQNDQTYAPWEDLLERKGDWWWNCRLNIYF